MNLPNVISKENYLTSPHEGKWCKEKIQGSFYQTMKRFAETHLKSKPSGDWSLINNVITGETLSTKELFGMGNKFAWIFKEEGLKVGDTIHILTGNSNYVHPVAFGAWILGGVVSPGDIFLEPNQIAKQLEMLEAKVLVCTQELAGKAEEIFHLLKDDIKEKLKVFCLGSSASFDNILLRLKSAPDEELEPYSVKNDHEEAMGVFWSSGTTGLPKGIVYAHSQLLNLRGYDMIKAVTPVGPSMVSSLCFYHIGGFTSVFSALMSGLPFYHVFEKDMDLRKILTAVRLAQPQRLLLGVHHYVQLSEAAENFCKDPELVAGLSSVELIMAFGSAFPQVCEQQIKVLFTNLKGVINPYGQTEIGNISIAMSTRSLGTLVPNTIAKICDPVSGKVLGPGQVGELCIKSNHGMMREYLKRPKESQDFRDNEGFGHTGDLVFFDEHGYLHFVDRIKEIIKYENNHVSPSELEEILQRHPAVKESLVFGKPDPRVQEIITAVVVLKSGYNASEEELIRFVNEKVTSYKHIRGGVLFRSSLPRTGVGKLLRREMRAWASKELCSK